MAPNPSLEAEYLKDKARRDLLNLLEGVRGKKNLVVSKDLLGPISLFVKFSVLQDYGVDKVFLLENKNVDSNQRNVIFLIHSEKAEEVQSAAEQLKRLQRDNSGGYEFSILCVPRRTLVCNKILEDEGVMGDANVVEFPLYFLPLEKDVLSLELEDSFGDLYLHHDPGSIFHSAKSLMQIQKRHGLFPRIVGKGDNARRLADLLLRMRKELDTEENSGLTENSARGLIPSSTIENLIIVDRDVDFATVLMTQLTYEGLVDEFAGIHNNQAEIDSTIVGPAPQAQSQGSSSSLPSGPAPKQGSKRKIQLDSSDQLFSQLRDANFAIVGGLLNKVARRLESEYERRHGAKSTSELREFVNKLPAYQVEHQSLKVHTNLAEDIMRQTRSDIFRRALEVQQNIAAGADPTYQHDTIEELIARDVPLPVVLRLLCLESCMAGGLRARDMDNFKKQIELAYGYQHLLTLHALEKMELLQSRSSSTALLLPTGGGSSGGTKTNYNYLRKHLKLIVDEVNEQDPSDVAYVYSGYAPLSIRLVQCVLQKPYIFSLIKGEPAPLPSESNVTSPGWLGFDDVIKSARGASFNVVQKGDEKAARARQTLTGAGGVKTVFVFFLGGITFTEIAALRFIATQESQRRRIIICTTGIINGNKMMDAAIEKGSFAKPSEA
ncbi:hypothetical protein FQN54_005046 [Arachnomyces sp. PD_36]|nr:hypothetical protein FQN54_005046 [Arachnomyces sp. PD_36]